MRMKQALQEKAKHKNCHARLSGKDEDLALRLEAYDHDRFMKKVDAIGSWTFQELQEYMNGSTRKVVMPPGGKG